MLLEYDPEADAIYISFGEAPYDHGVDLDESRRVDYGADGSVVGVELLTVSRGVRWEGLPEAQRIAGLLADLRKVVAA